MYKKACLTPFYVSTLVSFLFHFQFVIFIWILFISTNHFKFYLGQGGVLSKQMASNSDDTRYKVFSVISTKLKYYGRK